MDDTGCIMVLGNSLLGLAENFSTALLDIGMHICMYMLYRGKEKIYSEIELIIH